MKNETFSTIRPIHSIRNIYTVRGVRNSINPRTVARVCIPSAKKKKEISLEQFLQNDVSLHGSVD